MTKGTDTMREQHSDERSADVKPDHIPNENMVAPLMTVPDAEQIVAHLVEARDALAGRLVEYETSVKRLAYHAHGLHDIEARNELSDARESLRDLERQIAEHDAAITQARANVAEARRRVAVEIDRTSARDLRDELKTFRALGRQIDEALEILVDASHELRASLLRMSSLGCSSPNLMQLTSLGSRAIRTALLRTPWGKELTDMLPPSERRNFGDLIATWAAMVERNMIAPRLAAAENEGANNNGEAVNEAAH